MENKFCRKCGQANFPQVTSCAKCGAKLEQTPASTNPFNTPSASQQNDPPPTIAVNADSFKIPPPNQPKFSQSPPGQPRFNPPPPNQQGANQANSGGKSNKMFWIIGGIGGVLVLLFFVVAIAGIGGYFYLSSSSSDKETTREYPVSDDEDKDTTDTGDEKDNDGKRKLPRISTKSDTKETSGKFTNDELIAYVEDNKKTVGKYRLESVKAINIEQYFPDKDAGISALYKSGSKKVVHNMSMYSQVDTAKADFRKYVNLVKSTKAEIVSDENGNLIYRLEGMVYFVFCNESGGCHQMISKDGKDISDYYDSYFKK
jgi:hypothetical protein